MKKFTEQEREEIFRRSCELLEDKPSVTPPAPEPEPPPLVLEDSIAKWKREADEADAARAAARAKMKAQHNAYNNHDAIMQYVNALERRLIIVEEGCSSLSTLANGCVNFSNAVSAQLREFDMLTKKLQATLDTARAAHQREVDSLRTQLMAHAAMHTREITLLTNQLTETKHALSKQLTTANAHATASMLLHSVATLRTLCSCCGKTLPSAMALRDAFGELSFRRGACQKNFQVQCPAARLTRHELFI